MLNKSEIYNFLKKHTDYLLSLFVFVVLMSAALCIPGKIQNGRLDVYNQKRISAYNESGYSFGEKMGSCLKLHLLGQTYPLKVRESKFNQLEDSCLVELNTSENDNLFKILHEKSVNEGDEALSGLLDSQSRQSVSFPLTWWFL